MIEFIINRSNWEFLTNEEIVELFDIYFPNVTIQPNMEVVNELRRLGMATLELYENRSGSSVYRIRQTGEVFQIEMYEGKTFRYDDSEAYRNDEPFDQEVESFEIEDPKYIFTEGPDGLVVKRTKQPRFTARYIPDKLNNIDIIEWIDPVRAERLPEIMRTLSDAITRYISKNRS